MYGMWNVFSEMDFNLIVRDGNGVQKQVSVSITPPDPEVMEVGSDLNMSDYYSHFGDVYYLEVSDTDWENVRVTDVAS